MKFKKLFILTTLFLSITMLFGCAKKDELNPSFKDKGQKIYLYGEFHSNKKTYEEKLKIIEKHYNEGIKDMIVEYPFAYAEYLNLWLKEKDDKILDELFEDQKGAIYGENGEKEYFKELKRKFPEIVFHGADIEHGPTSFRYSSYIEDKKIKDDFIKDFVAENIKQKREYYESGYNHKYREEKMVENFKKQYEKIGNKSVFGFYGYGHVDLSKGNIHRKSRDGYIMGEELKKLYGDVIVFIDLTNIDLSVGKERLNVKGKEYNSKYFGKHELNYQGKPQIIEVWELENAYDDFKDIETYDTDIIYGSAGIAKLKKKTVYKLSVNGETSYFRTDEEVEPGVIQGKYLKLEE